MSLVVFLLFISVTVMYISWFNCRNSLIFTKKPMPGHTKKKKDLYLNKSSLMVKSQ